MAAIIGLPDEQIAELVEAGEAVGSFTVANRNSPGQIVVSAASGQPSKARRGGQGAGRQAGDRAAGQRRRALAADGARGRGDARASWPTSTFSDPRAPLLANADARPLTTGEECRAELVEHLTRGVDWVAAVETMTAAGVDTFVEVGPGKVLTGPHQAHRTGRRGGRRSTMQSGARPASADAALPHRRPATAGATR